MDNKVLDSATKVTTSLSRGLNIAATVVLALMMMMSVADVLLRHTLKWAIPDSQELVEFMMICVAFWAMAWCAVKKGHVAVDLLVLRFSPRTRAIFDSFTYFFAFFFCAVVSWRVFLEAPIVMDFGSASLLLQVPTYPFYFALALGLAVLCLVILIQFIQLVHKVVKG
jgi:TRAP-type C4-dicarboxylate transport system permease small subunit